MGWLTNMLSGGNEKKSINAAKKGIEVFDELETPDINQMIIELDELVQQGVYSPEQAQAILQESSATANVETDPELMDAQYDALLKLREIADQGGLTATDRARLSEIRSQEGARARGMREALLTDAQARGMGGAGTTLASNLISAQGTSNREAQRGLDVAADAEQRALQALMGSADLGGRMQETSYNQQMRKAENQDAINQFNTGVRNQVGLTNTAANNEAQRINLDTRQRIADANVGIGNEEEAHNKGLKQLDFENKYKKAAGKAGAYGGLSGAYGNAGANATNLWGTGIQAGSTFGAGLLNKKKNP